MSGDSVWLMSWPPRVLKTLSKVAASEKKGREVPGHPADSSTCRFPALAFPVVATSQPADVPRGGSSKG
jgi:hypothetical protein